MNRARRSRLDRVLDSLTTLNEELAEIGEEEREAFDSMPDGVRDSEQGQRAEAIADAIDGAVEEITLAIDAVWEADG